MTKIKYINKESCEIDKEVEFLGSATIGPNVKLAGKCKISDGAIISNSTISSTFIGKNCEVINSNIEESKIDDGCSIGPFSHLRPGTILGKNCKVGNFVEIKNSKIGDACKVSHLTYIGDATLKNNVNVGCGVVFANYDGLNKHHSVIGNNVFIGSNVNIVAPVSVGDNVFIAAGSTLTKDLSNDQFCIARCKETIKEDFPNKYSAKFQAKKYFGTDGIRIEGTDQEMRSLGYKFALALNQPRKLKIVIGRDTRKNGAFLREGFLAGLNNAEVFDLGIASTPCIAFMTKELSADFGVVFTASHNPPSYNGIKVFNQFGQKLNKNQEDKFEEKMQNIDVPTNYENQIQVHKIKAKKYIEKITQNAPILSNMEIAIDVSGGASEALAKKTFGKLGANLHLIGSNKNHIINDKCGCLNMDHLKNYMKKHNIPIGFSFDGDGDRVLVVDEKLQTLTGDNILYLIAKNLQKHKTLKNNCVVVTTMSNHALLDKLNKLDIATSITPVGDKYINEEMNNLDASLGGEESGHIIIREFSGSGDGLATAVKICSIIKEENKPLSNLAHIKLYPQILKSYKTKKCASILSSKELSYAIQKAEEIIGENGRVLVRKSGTEPKIRLLIECKSKNKCQKALEIIEPIITKFA